MNGDPYNSTGEQAKNVVKIGVKKRQAPSPHKNWNAWERVRKIARMAGYNPKVRVDPVAVAAAVLEKASAGRIKSLFVSIQWNDDSLGQDWSQMPRSSLMAHAFNAQATVQEEINKP